MNKVVNELFTHLYNIKLVFAGELNIEKDPSIDIANFDPIDTTPTAYTDKENYSKDRKQISRDLRKSLEERKKQLSICQ